MYTWHAQNSEKGARFAQAMESVSKSKIPALLPFSSLFVLCLFFLILHN